MENTFAASLKAFANLQEKISASVNAPKQELAAPTTQIDLTAVEKESVGTHYTDPTVCSMCGKHMSISHLSREDGTFERLFICWDDYTVGVVPDEMLKDFDPRAVPGTTVGAQSNPFGFMENS